MAEDDNLHEERKRASRHLDLFVTRHLAPRFRELSGQKDWVEQNDIFKPLVRNEDLYKKFFNAAPEVDSRQTRLKKAIFDLIDIRNMATHEEFPRFKLEGQFDSSARVLNAVNKQHAVAELEKLRASYAHLLPVEALRAKEAATYKGRQADLTDAQTRSLFGFLSAIKAAPRVDTPQTLQSFSFELPLYPKDSGLTRREKFALYAGRDALEFAPLDHAVAKIPIFRSSATEIASTIIRSTGAFTSDAIVGRSRQGKSIALSQVLVDIAAAAGIWCFWLFDKKRQFVCEDGLVSIQRFEALFNECLIRPRRVVFLFDDFSDRSGDESKAILQFQERWFRNASLGTPASFVFAVSERDKWISERAHSLFLDTAEEEGLFRTITSEQPIIARPRYSSFDNLLHQFPGEKRIFKDDVQALSDFILSQSIPVDEFKPFFHDINGETHTVKLLLSVLAVTQLIDLTLPEHILKGFLSAVEQSEFSPKKLKFADISESGNDSEEQWSGFRLTSPARARAILLNLQNDPASFIGETLDKIVAISMQRARTESERWFSSDSEFIRHLLQRLANPRTYPMPFVSNKQQIADNLFAKWGSDVLKVLQRHSDPRHDARWAGTLSQLKFHGTENIGDAEAAPERVVMALCESAIKLSRSLDGRALTPAFKAIRRLGQRFNNVESVQTMAHRAVDGIDIVVILEPVILSKDDLEWEHRANETILSFVQLAAWSFDVHGTPRRKSKILGVFQRIEDRFAVDGFRFDPGNSLERARNVEFVSTNEHYMREQAGYLWQARESVRQDVRKHGKWKVSVERAINLFEKNVKRPLEAVLEIN